jgi:hypothetical protein
MGYSLRSGERLQLLKGTRKTITTRDVTVTVTFGVLQWALQFLGAAMLGGLPGAERPIVAFPVGFVAAVTYLVVRKRRVVGATMLMAGIMQLLRSGFIPVIFEFVGGALGAEIVIGAAHALNGRLGKRGLALMAGSLMLGRGLGVTLGLLLFVPVAILSRMPGAIGLGVYIIFNGPIPFIVAAAGALSAAASIQTRGILNVNAV